MKVLILNPFTKITGNVVRDLIYGCWCKGKRIGGTKFPPLNLVYVATVLKEHACRVELLDAGINRKVFDDLKKRIKQYRVVIMTTSMMTFNEDAAILADLKKKNNNLITIIFGSHPTFMPKYCLSKDSIDIIVRREPEFIIKELIEKIEKGGEGWKNVKGIGYCQEEKIVLNDFYPFMDNLDDLPFPDRTMLPAEVDYFNPVVKRIPYTTMITSRGCSGKCMFCTVPSFYGNKIRCRSVENVMEELRIIQRQGYKEVFFRDETFTFYKKRNKRICEKMIEENMNLTWVCNARVGTVDKEIMMLMKKAGCHMIKLGVESGVQTILDTIEKGIDLEMTRKTFKWAHEVGIDIHAHLMLGSPGETKETVRQTIDFVKKVEPATVTFGICTPYPGTKLFRQVAENYPEIEDGSSCDLNKIHTKAFFNETFTSLTKKELEISVHKAYRSFYLRPSYLLGWLRRISSLNELKRVILAGVKIVEFSLRND